MNIAVKLTRIIIKRHKFTQEKNFLPFLFENRSLDSIVVCACAEFNF